jgi:hypothetical protein
LSVCFLSFFFFLDLPAHETIPSSNCVAVRGGGQQQIHLTSPVSISDISDFQVDFMCDIIRIVRHTTSRKRRQNSTPSMYDVFHTALASKFDDTEDSNQGHAFFHFKRQMPILWSQKKLKIQTILNFRQLVQIID